MRHTLKIALIYLLCVVGCDSPSKRLDTKSPRIRKSSQLFEPRQNQKVKKGDTLQFSITSTNEKIDSFNIVFQNFTITSYTPSFSLAIPSKKVGSTRYSVDVFINGKKERHTRDLIVLSQSAPKKFTYKIVNTYPHNTEDYTQGLLIKDGVLYESTGLKEKSTLKKKELKTGKELVSMNLKDHFFGEGLTYFKDQFYQLTWKAGKVLIYDNNLKLLNTLQYTTEGWGLGTYDNHLIMSDGTSTLQIIEPESFTTIRKLEVYDHKGPIKLLNELEIIDDLIYANLYRKNKIVAIHPVTGEVIKEIDLSGLLSPKEKKADVLNGIAYDTEKKKLYVTGKLWSKLFEIELVAL